MTRSVVFETPGSMDLRAITHMGVNAKPNSQNPFGFFGTGLKLTVAILVREGIPISLVTEDEVYAFYRKQEKFRDKNFDMVRMKRQSLTGSSSRTQYTELTYTTELGKTWKLWQAFRELESNTRDEGGRTYVVQNLDHIEYKFGYTYIVVTSDLFAEEYDRRDQTFLPDGLSVKQGTETIQVLDRPSPYIYYRGVRVYDLEKPSQFTYNFLSGVELTEDRTAKNIGTLKTHIAAYMLESNDQQMVERAVNAPGTSMESELSYTYHWQEPTDEFKQAVAARPTANPTAAAYVRSRAARVPSANPLAARPRPWALHEGWIVDRDGDPVLQWDFGGGLELKEARYVLALLQKDLDSYDLDDFMESEIALLERAGGRSPSAPVPVDSRGDDIPF